MGGEEVIRFGSLAEAPADNLLGRTLFDRVTEATVEWTVGQLDSFRVWEVERAWTSPPDEVPSFRFGRYDGLPRGFDAHTTARLLAQFAKAGCEFVLILRDEDGVAEREASIREGARAFLEKFHAKLLVCIGVPSLERESWVLSGFQSGSAREEEVLSNLKKELSFDPTLEAERLTDRSDHGVKSPKRVLEILVNRDRARESDCWTEAPLQVLSDRGSRNGLRSFLREAEASARVLFQR